MKDGNSTLLLGKSIVIKVPQKTHTKIKATPVYKPLDFCNSKLKNFSVDSAKKDRHISNSDLINKQTFRKIKDKVYR